MAMRRVLVIIPHVENVFGSVLWRLFQVFYSFNEVWKRFFLLFFLSGFPPLCIFNFANNIDFYIVYILPLSLFYSLFLLFLFYVESYWEGVVKKKGRRDLKFWKFPPPFSFLSFFLSPLWIFYVKAFILLHLYWHESIFKSCECTKLTSVILRLIYNLLLWATCNDTTPDVT